MGNDEQSEFNFEGKHVAAPPGTLLILGTDASGKNYVANFIEKMINATGNKVEKRDGWFSGKAVDLLSSEDKSRLSLLLEGMFLGALRFTMPIMPLMCGFLLQGDLARFKPNDRKVVVISHSAVRIIAFCLGHLFTGTGEIRISKGLEKLLRKVHGEHGIKTIVLDIEDTVRKKRIANRALTGKSDPFDRYMEMDGVRSERIEEFMVWIGTTYLDAQVIENNDLEDRALFDAVNSAFIKFGA